MNFDETTVADLELKVGEIVSYQQFFIIVIILAAMFIIISAIEILRIRH